MVTQARAAAGVSAARKYSFLPAVPMSVGKEQGGAQHAIEARLQGSTVHCRTNSAGNDAGGSAVAASVMCVGLLNRGAGEEFTLLQGNMLRSWQKEPTKTWNRLAHEYLLGFVD